MLENQPGCVVWQLLPRVLVHCPAKLLLYQSISNLCFDCEQCCFSRKKIWLISNVICMEKPSHVTGRHWKSCFSQLSQAAGSTAGLGLIVLWPVHQICIQSPHLVLKEVKSSWKIRANAEYSEEWTGTGVKDIRHPMIGILGLIKNFMMQKLENIFC